MKNQWGEITWQFLLPGGNFTNILWAPFAPKSFHQKITKPNCKYFKAVQRTLAWLSISPIFYKQLFHTKVLCAPFMCLQFGFVIFWQKNFGTKVAHKMLVKLTPGAVQFPDMFWNFYLMKNNKIVKNSATAKTREKISTYFESLEF